MNLRNVNGDVVKMKVQIASWFFFILFLCASKYAWAEAGSLCDKIQCSSHGTCVEIEEKPVCSCDDGFIADTTTSLTCIPYDIAMKLNEKTIGLNAEQNGDSELYSVERTINKHNLDLSYQSYKKQYPNRHYAWFWHKRYTSQKKIGAWFLVGSILTSLTSTMCFVVGIDTSNRGLVIGGIATSITTGVLLVSGIPIFVVGKRRVDSLNRLIENDNKEKESDNKKSSKRLLNSITVVIRGMSISGTF